MAVEVKVYCRKKKTNKTKQIDHIPKCFQLPRSASVSKPRTEFYLPICSFKEIELDPRSRKEIQSTIIVGCSDTSNDTIRGTADPFSMRSIGSQDRRQKTVTNGIQLPLSDVRLFGKRTHVQPCNNRNSENRDDALDYKEHHRPYKDLPDSPEGADVLNHHDLLHERDNSSSSSRARSKRERKPKVHFDEVSRPLHTSRKVRRFKIMRSLGLAAPVGSPFNIS